MKKIASFFAAVAAVAALSACSQDDSPVLMKPTEFKLNTPPFAEQLYQLTDEGQITLTCSQPDYGVGIETTYGIEISTTEDFAQSRTMKVSDPLSATLSFSTSEANLAILDMLGVIDEDTWEPYANDHVRPLYVRATAQAAQVEYSKITSNVVELPNVEFYYAIPTPGYIYLTGYPAFVEPSADYKNDLIRLFEDENAIGSNIYSAIIEDVPAQTVAFRFYTELTGWGSKNCLGAGEADMTDVNITGDFVDGVYDGSVTVNGQSNWSIDWQGGDMTITVDLNTNTIKIQAGAVEVVPPTVTSYIYICGNMASSDWTEPSEANAAFYDDWKLACDDNSGVYKATFSFPNLGADALYCRFYQKLTGWGAAQWASPTDADYEVTSGVAVDSKVGEGCFMLNNAKGKTVDIEVDTNTNKVKFTFVD